MSVRVGQGYCEHCKRNVLAQQNPSGGLPVILTLAWFLACGVIIGTAAEMGIGRGIALLAATVALAFLLWSTAEPWLCPHCGRTAR